MEFGGRKCCDQPIDMSSESELDTSKISSLGFWLQSSFPKYRKIVNGEERLIDGTENDETEIVKYDYTEAYKAALLASLKRNTNASQSP